MLQKNGSFTIKIWTILEKKLILIQNLVLLTSMPFMSWLSNLSCMKWNNMILKKGYYMKLTPSIICFEFISFEQNVSANQIDLNPVKTVSTFTILCSLTSCLLSLRICLTFAYIQLYRVSDAFIICQWYCSCKKLRH